MQTTDNSKQDTSEPFVVIALEAGAENPAIPAWANQHPNPARLSPRASKSHRQEVEGVPGAFQLLDVLGEDECARLVEISENLGFVEDAAVSLPRSIRHNDSFTWIVDDATSGAIFARCRDAINSHPEIHGGRQALGLNNRFRFYRYGPGDYFGPHTDGSWPGSRVVGKTLVANAFEDRWSELTFLVFLDEDYEGGSTRFHTVNSARDGVVEKNIVDVSTPKGAVLCFPHGNHPLHCVHASVPITRGTKRIIRTDVLFEL